jgi:sec-independent protein translocase protein TatA
VGNVWIEMATTLVPLFAPVPGGMEMFVILMIAVLLFGANKIPKLARSTGQAMGEFQKGRQQVEKELAEMEKEVEEIEETFDPDADLAADDDETDYMNLDEDEDLSTDAETETTTDSGADQV